jgi:hypothetical protein
MAPDKHNDLPMALVQEQRVRKRIKEQQEFRSMGCFTFDDIERKKSEMLRIQAFFAKKKNASPIPRTRVERKEINL